LRLWVSPTGALQIALLSITVLIVVLGTDISAHLDVEVAFTNITLVAIKAMGFTVFHAVSHTNMHVRSQTSKVSAILGRFVAMRSIFTHVHS
jgi:hypothetical protein